MAINGKGKKRWLEGGGRASNAMAEKKEKS